MTDALADRWTKFSWYGTRWITKANELAAEVQGAHSTHSEVLNHIEGILITAAEPPHNRQGGRFGEEVRQFLQYRDVEKLGKTTDEMIAEMWKSKISD